MATILLILIYIAFIGLGIPDSLFGVAWPAIYPEFELPISAASCVTLLCTTCTIISSLNAAKILNRFGTPRVTVVSTAMTAAALLGYSLSGSLVWLCLFSVPLGLGAGAIDTGLNNYVALHYNATHMSFLHCFYGVGVSISPYIMSLMLADSGNWRGGYRTAFYIQCVISVVLLLSLPLWGKVIHKNYSRDEEDVTPVTLKLKEMLRMPSVISCSMMFLGSCSIEGICGAWGSTYLVNSKGLDPARAASIVMFYYIGMAIGRFLSGVLASKLSPWKIIHLGQAFTLIAIVIILLPFGPVVSAIGLFLVGVGNAPLFPNLNHLTPQNFGAKYSQSVMGVQMSAGYVGFLMISPLFGLLAQILGTGIFPFYLLIIYAVMMTATAVMVKIMKKENRYF